jgi:hypothetical protein
LDVEGDDGGMEKSLRCVSVGKAVLFRKDDVRNKRAESRVKRCPLLVVVNALMMGRYSRLGLSGMRKWMRYKSRNLEGDGEIGRALYPVSFA